jgi:PAS domain S-box-containing protein
LPPVQPEPPLGRRPAAESAPPGTAQDPLLRILIIEDTPEDACLVQALLQKAGGNRFEIHGVDNLAAGLERLDRAGADAVILDLLLPDSSGIETFQRIQSRHSTIPVIVLTSLQDESMADLAIRHGAQDYLLKGRLDSSLLVRAIRYSIERKRAENALRSSEERFELMARATNDAVWDWDLSTNRMWWNVGVRSFLGYPPNTMGTDFAWWQEHIHPEDRERIISCIRSVIDGGGRFWIDEYRYLCADGSYACVFDRGYVIHDERGRPARMIGAMMDITDRKRAEEALRETNETLRTLIQASPLGISVIDGEERVRIWNPAAESIFGWKAHEILGHPLPTLGLPAQGEELPALIRRVFQGHSVTGMEFPGRRKDGSTVELSVSMAPLRDARGQISGAMAVVADVSERRAADLQRIHLEDQLRQSQKMEAVGRLAGGVAHDFNNLLTAITGYAELLQTRFDPGDDARQHVDEILRSSTRATQLTRQLLAFSRRQVLQPRVLSLAAVVQGVEGLLRRLIGEHIELTTVADPALGSVRADQGQVEQVLMNLAVNARDAMPSGGRLIIETRNVLLDDSYHDRHGRMRQGSHVLLSVTDTGVGMDEETRSHIFEPFFTTKEKDKGTGLGLATVYGIVKQSDGDIWVYSEPGRGTTFKIYFPRLEQAQEQPPREATRLRPRKGTETILLVEDSDVVRRLLRELLLQNGYTLLEARHGEEALALSAAHPGDVHLLLTDMVMPRMSGRDLARRLCPLRPAMKVLFMSGYTEEAIASHGVLEPGTAFLEKPFTPETITRKVRELLDVQGAPP